ncbi:hypothetical protein PHYBOEH_007450 [Phytophthora boehmeriae]|uniref:Crinkler (CRN) family protein n=1 Tax=Phytophthora boehmeriae TaxID=109152 RepID=A0A8T1WAY8_9STRA|nr:hypothetical protein PHYBOEH_007450 [Phytophthora boehmeriae]
MASTVPPAATTRAYYQLVDVAGTPLGDKSAVESTDVFSFRKAIKKLDEDRYLAGIREIDLRVYATKHADFDASPKLSLSTSVGDLEATEEKPIFVVAPVRVFWYQFMQEGVPATNQTSTPFRLVVRTDQPVIYDLQRAISTERLAGLDVDQLFIYANKEAFDANTPLRLFDPLGIHGSSKENPVCVVVRVAAPVRDVWYELIDDGLSDKKRIPDCIRLKSDARVCELRDAVFTKCHADLVGRSSVSLNVFSDTAAFEEVVQKPLEMDSSIDKLGLSKSGPIVVQAPRAHKPTATFIPPMKSLEEVMAPLIGANEEIKIGAECSSLLEWTPGRVYEIPQIHKFMARLGGCTRSGKVYWREEERRVVSLLLSTWFPEPGENINDNQNKGAIVIGSPGIGKSTLLCLLAFYLVFARKKNVLVYRKFGSNYLFYLGYNNDGEVVFFSQTGGCKLKEAASIYREFVRSQSDSEQVWLLLDGFHYNEVKDELLVPFKLLATSKQKPLKSQDYDEVWRCLLSCWTKSDLFELGRKIFTFSEKEMKERYYYSGGSVREFGLNTIEDIKIVMSETQTHKVVYRE